MKQLPIFLAVLCLSMLACDQSTPDPNQNQPALSEPPTIAKATEENYDIRNDSLIFSSATIENFDTTGRSTNVFWIGENRDTTLRFYRQYDANNNLIGARYYEPGDTEPNRDTVYINSKGLKVEASLNAEGQISWKSTIKTDNRGNEVVRTYENAKGEYRGLDSLYFDDQDRVVKGFYKNAKGRRSGIKTYKYLKEDQYDNWLERELFIDDSLSQRQIRNLLYHHQLKKQKF